MVFEEMARRDMNCALLHGASVEEFEWAGRGARASGVKLVYALSGPLQCDKHSRKSV